MITFIKRITLLTTFAAATGALFVASTYAATSDPHVTVVDPYIRLAPPAARVTAAFMVLRNPGSTELRLVGVDNAVAKVTELHEHTNAGGVMKMRQVKTIVIPAGGEAILQPGGLHVMLIDLLAPLKDGDNVPATLRFENGSSQAISLPVRSPVATGSMHKH